MADFDDIDSRLDDNESSLSNIESKLDSIESKLYAIESKVNDLPNSIIWFIVILIWAFVLFSNDFSCSIPAHKPFKQLTTDYTTSRGYHIVYNEKFSGDANFNPNEQAILFIITNLTKESVDLKDLKAFMWTIDDKRYGLKVEPKSLMDNIGDSQDYLNPGNTITFKADLLGFSPTLNQIQGFSVVTKDKEKIRFGYKPFLWLNELRWLIADNYRND